jgi:phosphosulfolactate phosphohydrolase-like enzyme
MKEELKKIMQELAEAIEDNLQIDDNVIFQEAVKIYLNEKTQRKDFVTKIEETINKKPINKTDEPATDKQKKYLENLGYEGKAEILTKEEAKQLIKEHLKKSNDDY